MSRVYLCFVFAVMITGQQEPRPAAEDLQEHPADWSCASPLTLQLHPHKHHLHGRGTARKALLHPHAEFSIRGLKSSIQTADSETSPMEA